MAMLKTCKAVAKNIEQLSPAKEINPCNGAVDRIRTAKYKNYKTADVKQVVELDSDYAYHHVIGLHGDQKRNGEYAGNDNGDFFWWRQTLLDKRKDGMFAYATWIGGDVLENHDETAIRGYIPDVWPIFEDKSIDMLMATNKKLANLLVTNIDNGKITDVSMGTIVGHSYCSIPGCHRHASKNDPNITEDNWCDHLKYHKGKRDPDTGLNVYEDNRDIFGVECSWITIGVGADADAKNRMKVAQLTENQLKHNNIAVRDRGIVGLYNDRAKFKR